MYLFPLSTHRIRRPPELHLYLGYNLTFSLKFVMKRTENIQKLCYFIKQPANFVSKSVSGSFNVFWNCKSPLLGITCCTSVWKHWYWAQCMASRFPQPIQCCHSPRSARHQRRDTAAKFTETKPTHKLSKWMQLCFMQLDKKHISLQNTSFLCLIVYGISNSEEQKFFSQGKKSLLELGKEMSHAFQLVYWFESAFTVECTR